MAGIVIGTYACRPGCSRSDRGSWPPGGTTLIATTCATTAGWRMTRTELLKGSMIFAAVIAVGLISTAYVNYCFAVGAWWQPSGLHSPCVKADGSWKHWSWGNVPTLSPKCNPDR